MKRSAWLLLLLAMCAMGPTAHAADAVVHTVPASQVAFLVGQPVFDKEQNEIGQLLFVLYGQNGQPIAAAMNVGGFMGVGARKVAVAWRLLKISIADGQAKIVVEMPTELLLSAKDMEGPDNTVNIVDLPR